MHRAFFTFAAFVTGSMMEGCPGHLVHLVNSATKRCPSSAAISSSSNSNSLRPDTLPHRSPPSHSSPAVAAVLSPVSSPGPPGPLISSPPDSVATRRFSSRPHHLFNVFLKVHYRKISQCSPNKDGGCRFEYTA